LSPITPARHKWLFCPQQWKRDELHVSAEIAEAVLKAMNEAEAGWQKAMDKIVERAGRTKGADIRR
jgi:hypothetical protein